MMIKKISQTAEGIIYMNSLDDFYINKTKFTIEILKQQIIFSENADDLRLFNENIDISYFTSTDVKDDVTKDKRTEATGIIEELFYKYAEVDIGVDIVTAIMMDTINNRLSKDLIEITILASLVKYIESKPKKIVFVAKNNNYLGTGEDFNMSLVEYQGKNICGEALLKCLNMFDCEQLSKRLRILRKHTDIASKLIGIRSRDKKGVSDECSF